MYTFEDKGGRSLTLRPESTASVVRAYLVARARPADAVQGVLRERRSSGTGARRRGGCGSSGSSGSRCVGVDGSRGRRRGDRAGRAVRARARARASSRLQLNSIGDAACRPAYRERLVAYLEPFRDQLDEDCRDAPANEPACGSSTARSTATKDFVLAAPRRSPITCARHARPISPASGAGSTTPGSPTSSTRGWSAASTTTRARRSNGSSGALAAGQAHPERRRSLRRARRGARGPGDAGRRVRDGAGPRPARDGGRGRRRSPPPRTPRCFVVAIGRRAARPGCGLVGELRDAGVPAAARARGSTAEGAAARWPTGPAPPSSAILGERELAERHRHAAPARRR